MGSEPSDEESIMRTQTDSDLNLGFVGLGNMGSGIAGSIARSLGRLMVYDIDETKRRSFALSLIHI